MTTGNTNAAATPGNGTARPPTSGTQSAPEAAAGGGMPEGVTSLFAAISPVAMPPVLPPPDGIKPMVAKAATPTLPRQRLTEQPQQDQPEQSAALPDVPENVELEVLPSIPEEATGVGVYTAMDAEAASEIAQAINSGMIVRDQAPDAFLPLRDRWVWSSVALASFVSAVLIAEGPAGERDTMEYVWWLVGTSLGSFPVAFGIGIGAASLARLAKVRSVSALRMSFAAGSIGLFLGLAMFAEGYVTELRSPKAVAYTPPPRKAKVVIVAQDPSAAVHAPVTQEKAVDVVRERHEQQLTLVAKTMQTLVDELNEELTEKQRRMGKEPIKSLLATNNFVNSKNFGEGKKRIELMKRISEDYEQRVMARYDHFPPRLRALELSNDQKKQLIQAFEKSRANAIGKLRETMMYDRAVLDEVRELYAFIQSRVGKFSVSNQLWFRDPKDAAVYNSLVKRVNDLSREQQRAAQQLHEVAFGKLTEIGKEVQWASLD